MYEVVFTYPQHGGDTKWFKKDKVPGNITIIHWLIQNIKITPWTTKFRYVQLSEMVCYQIETSLG